MRLCDFLNLYDTALGQIVVNVYDNIDVAYYARLEDAKAGMYWNNKVLSFGFFDNTLHVRIGDEKE